MADTYWKSEQAVVKSQPMCHSPQIHLFFSIRTIDSFTIFSGWCDIKLLNFLFSLAHSIESISVLNLHLLTREIVTKRMNKLLVSEKGLAPDAQTWSVT